MISHILHSVIGRQFPGLIITAARVTWLFMQANEGLVGLLRPSSKELPQPISWKADALPLGDARIIANGSPALQRG